MHAFDAAAYNREAAPTRILQPLPMFGRDHALALLVGNTRHLWAPFLRAIQAEEPLQRASDPLDRHVEGSVETALQTFTTRWEARFGHHGGDRRISMLRAAQASGFARTGPVHLAVHPTWGPWFGLRAVIVLDAPAPPPDPAQTHSPCDACPAPCRAASAHAERHGWHWKDILAIRDACPVGVEHRYSESQIAYHYTKQREALVLP